ncbi:MAG: peptide deformylase [Parcubacteria bacterium C7867-005]|nr:MAG: peptide deformylase [Parcubacteria bacterium C7867-005]
MKKIILNRDAPALRKIALEVPIKAIGTKKIQNILNKMKGALDKEDDGVAIAAPQIGESLRIFVVSGRTLSLIKNGDAVIKDKNKSDDIVFINPVLTKLSKSKKKMEEGCLSVRWLYGQVERSEKATIEAYDENGKKFIKGASGLMAQIFQHEVDHLNGVLFIDKATNVENIPPKKENE